MKSNQISIANGIYLGLGSLIGSGIIFLPSKIHAIARNSSPSTWLIGSAFCITLIPLFRTLTENADLNDGIRGLINAGPLKNIRTSISLLVLGTVAFGMPCSAILIAKNFSYTLGTPALTLPLSLLLICTGFLILRGMAASGKLIGIFAIIFILLSALVFGITLPNAKVHYSSLQILPDANSLKGVTLCFWAFAGFENLLFLGDRFKNPTRSIPLAMTGAIAIATLTYLALQINFTALAINDATVDNVDGLLVLARHQNSIQSLPLVIGIFSLAALIFNFLSWYSGLFSLAGHAAKSHNLPRRFDEKSIFILLLLIQFAVTNLLYVFPDVIDFALTQVSTNFIVIYWVISLTFYSQLVRKKSILACIGVIISISITCLLLQKLDYLIYPSALFFIFPSLFAELGHDPQSI